MNINTSNLLQVTASKKSTFARDGVTYYDTTIVVGSYVVRKLTKSQYEPGFYLPRPYVDFKESKNGKKYAVLGTCGIGDYLGASISGVQVSGSAVGDASPIA